MFANQQKFIIHNMKESCDLSISNDVNQNETNFNDIENQVNKFLQDSYPKNKMLPLVMKILLNHTMIDSDLFFVQFNNIHIADFCSFINNRFGKKEQTNPSMFKLCKFIQNKAIRFPKIAIKNPIAQKLLT